MVIYHEMNILKFTKVQGATGWFKNCPCQCSMQAGKPIPILSHWCISFHELEDLHFQFVVFPHHAWIRMGPPPQRNLVSVLRLHLSM